MKIRIFSCRRFNNWNVNLNMKGFRPLDFGARDNSTQVDAHPKFPSAVILGAEDFAPLRRGVLDLRGQTPKIVLDALEIEDGIQQLCDTYFVSIHRWLPILSKKRLTQNLHDSPIEVNPVVALLLICMKAVMQRPEGDNLQTPLYRIAKDFLSYTEDSGSISLPILQAAILVSVYEISHGIHPAGFLSVSHTCQLGTIMGLHNRQHAMRLFKESDTWTLREEERRTWWAVLLLDRYVHSGTNGFPLFTCEPLQSDLLPCDAESWDEGLIGSNEPLYASNPVASVPGDQFATVCRAAHILGRVLRHRDDYILGVSDKLLEAGQLHRALLSFEASFIDHTPTDGSKQSHLSRAICYSARLILFGIYACNERYGDYRLGQETDMQKTALGGLATVTLAVSKMAQQLQHDISVNLEAVSPLSLHCIYLALGECAWFVREDRSDEMKEAMDLLLYVLRSVGPRWRVCADEYLRLFEAGDGSD
ncbi:uncharacterized protein Z518_06432 [Rhinocladiella mackenziei CBS 650.93]|uniref:Xylanolytic transcriptional activator regulatory domain-containing protein n=1 Tax=Rhinocladiella mackenziei CBS 650.93 TaxID=1442369 RepID=A0A0D2J8X0_9EURO|nr:uncharacterized protein Z518_06432 [Rhinocladiella mackenziei CBS 650.93]KIX05560.1 hypothetical protein Z518_06432 [Rhinocladiella mackenziei CBS 650.93]